MLRAPQPWGRRWSSLVLADEYSGKMSPIAKPAELFFLVQGTEVSSLWPHREQECSKGRTSHCWERRNYRGIAVLWDETWGQRLPIVIQSNESSRPCKLWGACSGTFTKAKMKFRAGQRTCKGLILTNSIIFSRKIQFFLLEKPQKIFPCLALEFKIVTVPNRGNSQNPTGLQQMHSASWEQFSLCRQLPGQVHCFGFPLPSIWPARCYTLMLKFQSQQFHSIPSN